MTEEIWKEIPGYEGKYWVSTHGRVRSNNTNGNNTSNINRIKKFTCTKGGYLRVWLHSNKKRRQIMVHTLVAQAFTPNPENKPEINHIDFIRENNYVSNLQWVTRKENVNYSKEHMRKAHLDRGRKKGLRGVHWDKHKRLWRSAITIYSQVYALGRFKVKQEAYSAFWIAYKEWYGEIPFTL